MSSDDWGLVVMLGLVALWLWLMRSVLFYRLSRRKWKSGATITTYPAWENFQRYLFGEITLKEFRAYKGPSSITKPLEFDEPHTELLKPAYFARSFFRIKIVWGAPVEMTVYGRRKMSQFVKWYGVSVGHLSLTWLKPRGEEKEHVFREGPDRRGGGKDATWSESMDRPSDPRNPD